MPRLSITMSVAVLVGCSWDPVSADSTTTTPLIGGAVDHDHPAVVAVLADGALRCTGTLVAPAVVLTAAHCVEPSMPGAAALSVAVMPDGVVTADEIEVVAAYRHPRFDAMTSGADLAMLRLARTVDGVAPLTLAAEGRPIATGAGLVAVGFGRPALGADPDGSRRAGVVEIDGLEPTVITLRPSPSQPCHGDSGGPLLAGDVVVGVISQADCETWARAARTDTASTFLAAALAGAGLADGAACADDTWCDSGDCRSLDGIHQFRYCVRTCDADNDCPAGTCAPDLGGGTCVPPRPWPHELGAACVSPLDCLSDTCEAIDGEPRCTRTCDSDETCGVGAVCAAGRCELSAPSSGGCSTGAGPSLLAGLLLLLCLGTGSWVARARYRVAISVHCNGGMRGPSRRARRAAVGLAR